MRGRRRWPRNTPSEFGYGVDHKVTVRSESVETGFGVNLRTQGGGEITRQEIAHPTGIVRVRLNMSGLSAVTGFPAASCAALGPSSPNTGNP
jgi:hypothetical protein